MCLLRGTDWIFIYNSTFCPHSVFICFAWISEQIAIISLYSINLSVFKTEAESVYCAVRNRSLTQTDTLSYLKVKHVQLTQTKTEHVGRRLAMQWSGSLLNKMWSWALGGWGDAKTVNYRVPQTAVSNGQCCIGNETWTRHHTDCKLSYRYCQRTQSSFTGQVLQLRGKCRTEGDHCHRYRIDTWERQEARCISSSFRQIRNAGQQLQFTGMLAIHRILAIHRPVVTTLCTKRRTLGHN